MVALQQKHSYIQNKMQQNVTNVVGKSDNNLSKRKTLSSGYKNHTLM